MASYGTDEALVNAFLERSKGFSYRDRGEFVGVSRGTIQRWVTGEIGELRHATRRSLEKWLAQPAVEQQAGATDVRGKKSRAKPVLDTLARSGEIRRGDAHLGVGSRIAIILDTADDEAWTREELVEALERVREWGEEAERLIADLYAQLRARDRDDPGSDDS